MCAVGFPGFHDPSHAVRTIRIPYEGIPIRGNEYGATARPEYTECLGKNAVHVGHILGDLSAGNDIKAVVGLA